MIGVLAVQGGFAAHVHALTEVGLRAREVRSVADVDGLTGLVLPGGESGVQLELIRRLGLAAPLSALVARGAPVLATCAGLILAARTVRSPAQTSFGFIDVTVERNAYGRQLESFEARDDAGARTMLFIRAPKIIELGGGVEVLATLRGEPVLVRQGRVVGCAYHPELTTDVSLHREIFASTSRAAA